MGVFHCQKGEEIFQLRVSQSQREFKVPEHLKINS